MRNLERVILKVQKNVTNILLNAFTKQQKKHLERKFCEVEPSHFISGMKNWTIGKRKKRKMLEMD